MLLFEWSWACKGAFAPFLTFKILDFRVLFISVFFWLIWIVFDAFGGLCPLEPQNFSNFFAKAAHASSHFSLYFEKKPGQLHVSILHILALPSVEYLYLANNCLIQ